MASKHDHRNLSAVSNKEIEEMLHRLSKLMDRLKVMYEQYFMGIQKMAPTQLHKDAERKIRELTQLNIRNTALRFRFANLSQKFGSYNTYWKRTMRQIESGTYLRHIQRAARKANAAGKEIPEEILAAMPKRVREKILRDRDRVRRVEERKAREAGGGGGPAADSPQWRKENVIQEEELGGFDLADAGDDFDLDSAFASITADAAAAVSKHTAKPAAAPRAAAKPPARPARRAATPPPIPGKRPAAAKPASPRPAARPAARPSPRPAPRPVSGSPIPGMSVKETQDLHRRYNQGQKMVGGGKAVSYDQLMKTLKRQAPKILKQSGAKGVKFAVAIKDDKVILKAKPEK